VTSPTQAGKPVEATIDLLVPLLDKDDLIIDGGNEWYPNTEARSKRVAEHGILYMGMGVSEGEEGARFGPSMMPGGPVEAWDRVKDTLIKASAKHESGAHCVAYSGKGGAGNYVKMVHNCIEYGDMQLIAEAYDILKLGGGLSNDELGKVFDEWNNSELKSFLIEISANIFKKFDDRGPNKEDYLLDKVMDKTGSNDTGKWTCQDAADVGVDSTTMVAALNARYGFYERRTCCNEQNINRSATLQCRAKKKNLLNSSRKLDRSTRPATLPSRNYCYTSTPH